MSKRVCILAMLMASIVIAASAQKVAEPAGSPMFKEATAREAFPNVAVFVFPQICDMQMLTQDRVQFGPYAYPLPKDGKINDQVLNQFINNDKSRALQNACIDYKADLIIEPLYTTTIYDSDPRTIYITISGYPAKYVNFRSLKPEDINMIRALYPGGVERLQQQNEGKVLTEGIEDSKK